jgi:hypothetical protein
MKKIEKYIYFMEEIEKLNRQHLLRVMIFLSY